MKNTKKDKKKVKQKQKYDSFGDLDVAKEKSKKSHKGNPKKIKKHVKFVEEKTKKWQKGKKLKGTMDVEIPEDCSEKELEKIQKVLGESIANSLGLNEEDIGVTIIDSETGEANYVISIDDPTLAEETQKVLKDDDFVQNANKAIGVNNENLTKKIREILEINDVNPDKEIDVKFISLKTKKKKNLPFLILFQIPTKIVFHHISQSPTKFIA